MRTSIQVSERLRRKLGKRKRHPRETYEEVIENAIDEASRALPPARPVLAPPIADALREVTSAIRAIYGERLVRLVLYGSHARGDATPGSDVDVLVVLQGTVERGREITRLVDATYDVLLGRGVHVSALPMSETEFLTRATPLLLNVRREGIPL